MKPQRSLVGLALALTSACSSAPSSPSVPNTVVASAGNPSVTAQSGAAAGSSAGGAGATANAAGAAGARAVSSGAAGSASVQPTAASGAQAPAAGVGSQQPATAGADITTTTAGAGGQPATAGGSGVGSNEAGSTASGAPGDCQSIDAVAVLRGYAPQDEEAAADFEDYLTSELGSLTCATGGNGDARTITQTIFVPPNTSYDGHGEKLTADVAAMRCDTSEGEQAEHQRPYFVLAPGATLKNVTITYPGCEGVHMLGDNTLENVVWEDAGEDAASVRSYFPGGKITISHSEGHKAADKMFQFNAACDVKIESFSGSDMGKLVRQNGGKDFPLKIDLNTVNLTGVISAVVQSDSPQCFVRHHALEYAFTGSGDKADRVFRDIPPGNITEY